MFVDTKKLIDIVADGDENKPYHEQNIIRIRERLTVAEKSQIDDQYISTTIDASGKAITSASIGKLGFALLVHYVAGWSGPAFAGIPCNAENIGRLDEQEPLVIKAARIVGKRWQEVHSRDPKDEAGALSNGQKQLTAGENQTPDQ